MAKSVFGGCIAPAEQAEPVHHDATQGKGFDDIASN